MTRRDWWLGIMLVASAILLHALIPRYDWRHVDGAAWSRVDRWTGDLRFGTIQQTDEGARWVMR